MLISSKQICQPTLSPNGKPNTRQIHRPTPNSSTLLSPRTTLTLPPPTTNPANTASTLCPPSRKPPNQSIPSHPISYQSPHSPAIKQTTQTFSLGIAPPLRRFPHPNLT